jgi:hypothetical protein
MAEQKGGRALLTHGRPSEHVRQSVHVTEPGAGRPRHGRPGSCCAHMQSTKIVAAVAACLAAGRRRASAGGTNLKLPASARRPNRPGVAVGGESSVIPSGAVVRTAGRATPACAVSGCLLRSAHHVSCEMMRCSWTVRPESRAGRTASAPVAGTEVSAAAADGVGVHLARLCGTRAASSTTSPSSLPGSGRRSPSTSDALQQAGWRALTPTAEGRRRAQSARAQIRRDFSGGRMTSRGGHAKNSWNGSCGRSATDVYPARRKSW